MARIAGVDLPKGKRIEVALTYIFGVGRTLSAKALKNAGIDPNRKSEQLTEDEVAKVRDHLEKLTQLEGELRRTITTNIKRLMDLGTYRGVRHRKNLPVRGQRTHTNARTRKGPRKTVAVRKQLKVMK